MTSQFPLREPIVLPLPGVKKKNSYATAIMFRVCLFLYGLLSFIYPVGAVIYCSYYCYFDAVIADG
jgi:hypothetical protein